jgi:hypothetical protein
VNGFALTKVGSATVFDDNLAVDAVFGGLKDWFLKYAGDTDNGLIDVTT